MNKFGKLWIGASAAMLLSLPTPVNAETIQTDTSMMQSAEGEQQAEQPVQEEPVQEEQQAEQSVQEEQQAEQSVQEEQQAEEQQVEEPVQGEQQAEEPLQEEQPAEEQQVEEPVQEEQQAEQQQTETDVLTDRLADGWGTDEFGNQYYVQNGEKVCDQVIYIDDAYYGFGWDGKMYADMSFSIYNSDTQKSAYYRAKSDGKLYVNEWYSTDWDKYYYGEGGAAYTGIHEISGHLYGFNEYGAMYKNTTATIEGENYVFDENGYGTKLNNNDWTQIGTDWYYVQNGEKVCNKVLFINNAYYGFNRNGKMYSDTSFQIDGDNGKMIHYRAREGGALYENEWYESDWEKYYYGSDCAAYIGIHEISGHLYGFSEYGAMYKNTTATFDGENYVFDENGYGTKLNNDGWTQVGTDWYYIQNSEIIKNKAIWIDESQGYYGFDRNGKMYINTAFSIYNESGNPINYRADINGKLYNSGWYQDEEKDYYYYYGSDCVAYAGIHEISGHLYGFSKYGIMYKNTTAIFDGNNYVFDENGYGNKIGNNGWNKVGTDWYYIQNGELIQDKVIWIEESQGYYGFDWNGKMYVNTAFSIYNDETGKSMNYRADGNGKLYNSGWYQDQFEDYYYYGADCTAYTGLQIIDGVTYAFNEYDGRMYKNYTGIFEGENYVFDENGHGTELTNNSWTPIGDNWYYVKDNQALKDCVEKIGNEYYGFDWNGKMIKNPFSRYDSEEKRYISYRPKGNGSLYVNSWYDENGTWYYYGEAGKSAKGYTNVSNTFYFFYEDGRMCINSIEIDSDAVAYRTDANGHVSVIGNGWTEDLDRGAWIYVENEKAVRDGIKQIGNSKYVFSNYYMYENKTYFDSINKKYYLIQQGGAIYENPGWKDLYGSWYYVKGDGTLYTGVLNDGGHTYYMNPHMVHNAQIVVTEDGKNYLADKNGYLIEITSDGFYQGEDGKVYYVKQGKLSKKTWESINGDWYYFDENGVRVNKTRYVIGGIEYSFAQDGKMYANAWVPSYSSSDFSYAGVSGALVKGEQYIDGIWYFFNENGRMVTGAVNHDEQWYLYGDDGAYVGRINSEGWNYLQGNYYYLINGEVIRGQLLQVGNEYYGFDYQGKMYQNTNEYINGERYYFGSSGAAMRGWIKVLNQYYYGDPDDAKLITNGKKEIDGATYYFMQDGSMATGETYIDGKWYHFADSGALISITDVLDDWSLCDGFYYYYKNGKPFTGWVGDYYINHGVMHRDDIIQLSKNEFYALDYKGKYLRNTWTDVLSMYEGDRRSYAKENGRLAFNEWMLIDGTWYYFSGIYTVTGYQKIDGVGHWFDDFGKYLGAESVSDGWIYKDGHYYFVHAGEPVENQLLNIDDAWYYFDVRGRMIASQIYYINSDGTNRGWYFDSNGKKANYTGWKMINGKWQYFDSESNVVTGFVQVGNKWYYINGYQGMVTGYHYINGKLYYFDASGACVKKVSMNTGWYNGDVTWYYFESGNLVANGMRNIGGTNYFFVDGELASEGVYYNNGQHVYVNNAGIVDTAKGWHLLGNKWIYVKADGSVATGVEQIDGTVYYFSWEGIMEG